MEQERFDAIVSKNGDMLQALMSPMVGARGGRGVFYNAYFNGTEVVVVGYQFEEDGHSYTKPVAILVDDEVFNGLRVDRESGRVDPSGTDTPKRVL